MNLGVAKYWNVFVSEFKRLNEYKLNFIGKTIKFFIQITFLFFIWQTIFTLSGKEQIANLSFFTFITYITLTKIIGLSMHPWQIVLDIEEKIIRGDIANFIVRPIGIIRYFISKFSVHNIFHFFAGISIFLIIANILKQIGISIFIQTNPLIILFFLISFFLAFLLNTIIYITVGFISFWFGEVWSIIDGFRIIQGFLGGEFFPITIHSTLYTIAKFLPFHLISFFPIFTYLGELTTNEILQNIGLQIIWLIALALFAKLILKLGLKKFDSQGG